MHELNEFLRFATIDMIELKRDKTKESTTNCFNAILKNDSTDKQLVYIVAELKQSIKELVLIEFELKLRMT